VQAGPRTMTDVDTLFRVDMAGMGEIAYGKEVIYRKLVVD